MKANLKLADGTLWPNPLEGAGDNYGVAHRLRYGPVQRSDHLVAASAMGAWQHLIMGCSRRRQVEVLKELKRLALAEAAAERAERRTEEKQR